MEGPIAVLAISFTAFVFWPQGWRSLVNHPWTPKSIAVAIAKNLGFRVFVFFAILMLSWGVLFIPFALVSGALGYDLPQDNEREWRETRNRIAAIDRQLAVPVPNSLNYEAMARAYEEKAEQVKEKEELLQRQENLAPRKRPPRGRCRAGRERCFSTRSLPHQQCSSLQALYRESAQRLHPEIGLIRT
jgi:hypothetical protein